MGAVRVNFKSGRNDAVGKTELLTTSASNAVTTASATATWGVIEIFTDVPHIISVGPTPDASADLTRIYVPKCDVTPYTVQGVRPGTKVAAVTP